MPTVKPFAALRPDPARAARICELPYDVLSSAEARVAAADNPLSFFHVSKPEIDLPAHTNSSDPSVYRKGKESFSALLTAGALRRDRHPRFYLYRQVMGAHTQLGLVALAACAEYLDGQIRRHELTRPEKEEDRVRHIESLNAQTGPAFLIYPADAALDQYLHSSTNAAPDIDFVAADGVRHTSWTIANDDAEQFIKTRFASLEALYIADGHHRTAAAARVYQTRHGAGLSAFFLSVLFPHDQVRILPYHRVLTDLNGLTPAELLARLDRVFEIHNMGRAQPSRQHEVGLYLAGEWLTLVFRPGLLDTKVPIERLDVTLLQKYVLAPIFGIEDPRTSSRIQFVGGIRGTGELERLAQSGECACSFSMYPTRVEDLMEIARAGGLMPPKSTWFEPKLRDGMFSHLLD